MIDFTAAEKLHEIEREIEMRRNAYPKWVNSGRLDLAAASRRMSIIRAIAEDYQRLADAEFEPASIGNKET